MAHATHPPHLFLIPRSYFLSALHCRAPMVYPFPLSRHHLSISLTRNLSLSPLLSLFLSLRLSFSLLDMHDQAAIWNIDSSTACMRWQKWFREGRTNRDISMWRGTHSGAWTSPSGTALLRCPPTTFTVVFGSQQVHLSLLMKMVPSIPNEGVQIVSMHFREKDKTLSVNLSQTEPYFELSISYLYLW